MNIGKLIKEAQRIQEELSKLQEEVANTKFEATAGGGVVRVAVMGDLKPVEIKIDKEALEDADPEMLEDMILSALEEAIEKAKAYTEKRMLEITGSAGGFPGAGGMFPGFPGGIA
jgi:hypothetical protein